MMQLLVLITSSFMFVGCAFNFELTSQKTALENQVMGSYKELDDEVLLMASVRGVAADGTKKQTRIASLDAKKATTAKQNQEFNRDDLDDLKIRQILGEAKDGQVVVLPKGTGLSDQASEGDLRFAEYIRNEENRDREIIVKRIVSSHQDLNEKNFNEAKAVYRKSILDSSPVGTWIENEDGTWVRKTNKVNS